MLKKHAKRDTRFKTMGIGGGLIPPGGGSNNKNKKPNREKFTSQTDILTGSENRRNYYILKSLADALVDQSDAITNFKRSDKAFLPGVSGILKKPIRTITLKDIEDGVLDQPGATDFLAPNAVAGIRIKNYSGRKILGTTIFVNDAARGFQEENDAAFFLGRYNLSRSSPFRYENSLLLN